MHLTRNLWQTMSKNGDQSIPSPIAAVLTGRSWRGRPTRWLLVSLVLSLFLWMTLNRRSTSQIIEDSENIPTQKDLEAFLEPTIGDVAPTSELSQVKSDVGWKWESVKEIYAFGDSWTTTNFDPNGDPPREENPMGNPEFPVDQTKRVPDWIEYLTGAYNASFVRTYNLARGASTIDRDIVMPLFPSTWCFDEQVNDQFNFHYNRDNSATASPSSKLFIIFFGLVDIALLVREGPVETDLLEKMALRYEEILEQLYALSARQLLLISVPPIDKAPDPINKLELRSAIMTFNLLLTTIRDRLCEKHAEDLDYVIKIFDMNKFMNAVLYDPKAMRQTQDIKNRTENCWDYNPDVFNGDKAQPWDYLDQEKCGVRRDQYFWANTLHVTHPVQEAIAAGLVEECFEYFKPGKESGKRKERMGMCE